MDVIGLGAVLRAVRLRRGWRQLDVAARARGSQPMVSRIERGHVRSIPVGTLMRVAEALEVRVDIVPRWRGGSLDRMLSAGHAALHLSVARILSRAGWQFVSEKTFAIYGERGAIDIFAFHPAMRSLLVIELKTALVDIHGLLSAVDRYRRLAPRIAAELGWRPESVSTWIVFLDTPTNRRRIARHADVLKVAYPSDGRTMRSWMHAPAGPISALSFVAPPRSGPPPGAQRVRSRVR